MIYYKTNWDFGSIWSIDSNGSSIAYLKKLPKPDVVTQTPDLNGSEEFPYKIETVEDLINIKNDLKAYYILDADLDLSEIEDWTAIGSSSNRFIGSFDGNNHKICNLSINTSRDYNGLFGYVENEIKKCYYIC